MTQDEVFSELSIRYNDVVAAIVINRLVARAKNEFPTPSHAAKIADGTIVRYDLLGNKWYIYPAS